jgi:hypothetical protein
VRGRCPECGTVRDPTWSPQPRKVGGTPFGVLDVIGIVVGASPVVALVVPVLLSELVVAGIVLVAIVVLALAVFGDLLA